MTPEHFQEIGQVTTLRESVETILHCTVSRVQEVCGRDLLMEECDLFKY